jgi:large subunit ribosomal protein L6
MFSMTYPIPSDVQVEVSGRTVTVKGKGKEVKKYFKAKHVEIKKDGTDIVIFTESKKRRDRADIGTIQGHIKNMIVGIEHGVTYKLKAVYAHFPMTMKVEGPNFVVNNFLGEKFSRKIPIVAGATIQVKGQEITVTGVDKDAVSLCAAQIEQICKVRDRDRRIFQDGIYIIEKDGKPLK